MIKISWHKYFGAKFSKRVRAYLNSADAVGTVRCGCAHHAAPPDERRDREKGDRSLEESDPPTPEDK